MIAKRICAGAIAAATVLGLVSCAKPVEVPTDILTQTVISKDKIPVTVLVKHAFTIHSFEKTAEEKFPELDIIQVGNYTADMGVNEYEARLKNDDLTDIVMTWPLDVGEQYWGDRLLDLSSLPISGKYNTAMLNTISRNGALHYLPGPSQVRGIVYNKTLFDEKGWEVPDDFDGFIELCQTIEESGIRSLQLGLGNAEVLDTAFVGYGHGNGFGKPEDAQWLDDYNAGKGSFGDHYSGALDTFQTLIDEGVLKKEDLQITYADREKMLFARECAMVEDSVLLARTGNGSSGSGDEFGLMPFFCPGEENDWARLYAVCYIGVNKHLSEKENKKKYDLVMRLLEYISTPEGQTALAADTGAMFSGLNGTNPPDVPEITDLLPALENGRYEVFPTLKNAQDALRLGLAGMVKGTMTAADVIAMVDQENLSPPVAAPLQVLGTATEDFTLIETGNFITDAMRAESGCEIALFLDNGKDGKNSGNGKGVAARIYKGEQTARDIRRIYPDTRADESGIMLRVTMTGADLLKTLEYAVPVDNGVTGWFYYFSGLIMTYDPTAEPGKRIEKITDDKGNAIDPERIYSVAVMDGSVPDARVKTREEAGIFITELIAQTIKEQQTISPSKDGRFTVPQK